MGNISWKSFSFHLNNYCFFTLRRLMRVQRMGGSRWKRRRHIWKLPNAYRELHQHSRFLALKAGIDILMIKLNYSLFCFCKDLIIYASVSADFPFQFSSDSESGRNPWLPQNTEGVKFSPGRQAETFKGPWDRDFHFGFLSNGHFSAARNDSCVS